MEEAVGTAGACRVFGKSRATVYRKRNPVPRPEGPRERPAPHPAELSADERAAVLAELRAPEFTDKSPGQVYTILLDRGVYLCSEATMYRVLREHGESGERRAQATHPAKKKPELMAEGPNQVWSWDIERHEAPRCRAEVRDLRLRASQGPGEAGGSLTREVPGRAASSPDNDGTPRHYRMGRARQARQEGGREEPAPTLLKTYRQLKPGG
jgi:hypothetical protein